MLLFDIRRLHSFKLMNPYCVYETTWEDELVLWFLLRGWIGEALRPNSAVSVSCQQRRSKAFPAGQYGIGNVYWQLYVLSENLENLVDSLAAVSRLTSRCGVAFFLQS